MRRKAANYFWTTELLQTQEEILRDIKCLKKTQRETLGGHLLTVFANGLMDRHNFVAQSFTGSGTCIKRIPTGRKTHIISQVWLQAYMNKMQVSELQHELNFSYFLIY